MKHKITSFLGGAFLACAAPAMAQEPPAQAAEQTKFDILAPQDTQNYRLPPEESEAAKPDAPEFDDEALSTSLGRLHYQFAGNAEQGALQAFAGRGEGHGREIYKKSGQQEIQRRGRGVAAGMQFSLSF